MNQHAKRLNNVVLVCAFGLCFVSEARAQNPTLGMVLNVEGDVSIQRGAQKKPAARVDFLYASDKLVVGKGRADVLVCTSPERWVLTSGAALEFAPGGVKQTAGPASQRRPAKCLLPDIKVEDKDRLRFGGLSPRGLPPIALLLGGTITKTRPAFDWVAVKNAQSYEIALRDDAGDILWEAKANSNHLDYPAGEPALKAAMSYQWEVKAISDKAPLGQQIATLEIKPNDELSKPVPVDAGDKLLRAAALENAQYYAEAAALYRQLRGTDSTDSRLGAHLIWLYGNAGLIAAAGDEMSRLGPVK